MKFSLFTAVFALLTALPLMAHAMDNAPVPQTEMKEVQTAAPISAVAFHSDSCGSCKILGPRMKEAMEIINKDKVNLVKFDFTNKETIEKTKALAIEKKVGNILQKYGAKTGFVVLVDGSGNVVDELKVDDDTPALAAKIATAIANAS